MTIAEALSAVGIKLRNYQPGEHTTTCPQCSAQRKPQNRKKPCLSVKIDERGACYLCHHCGWKGATHDGLEYRRDQTPGGPRHRPRDRIKSWHDKLRGARI